MTIALILNSAYSISVAKTKATGFDDSYRQRRTHRPKALAVFLRSCSALVRLLWVGHGGSTYGYADFLCHRFVNSNVCLPTSFDDGEQVNKPDIGGHNMAAISISARPEQTHFPITQKEARKAARQWFGGWPTETLAQWRDTCRQAAIDGLPNPKERGLAFNNAFAQEVGDLIIGGGRSHE